MSLSKKGIQTNDTQLSTASKVTTLNPHAAEFIPFSLRSPSGSTSTGDAAAKFAASGTLGKAVLDRSESSVSNNSDEEARQYWSRQLPDDITPDFKVTGEDESQGLGNLSLSRLSIHDGTELSRFSAPTAGRYVLNEQQELSPHHINGNSFTEKVRYPVSSYGEDPSSASFLHLPAKPWDRQIVNSDQLISNGREGPPYNGNSRHGFLNDVLSEHSMVDDNEMNPVEFLATQFPGFAAESLAEVYFANQCDLSLTIEMLTQLELQVDGGFNQNLNSKTLPAPNLSALDFPALTVQDGQNGLQKFVGDDLQHSVNPYRSSDKDNLLLFKSSSSSPSRGAIDFASAVRKLASQDSANMYSELREEARDHARLRNAYFEQARQAYLIGNKALAKELSVKGQLHNMHMKAAHGKAQESIYRQRNPISPEMQGNGRAQERMIDLHGLHVSEAIHVLKHELSVLRSTARSADQRLQVYICVGTGHHTRGSRTPARLPVAIQRYLLEEEGLDYTEPQPGLLRVVIY
ncbi:hypothetical protein L1049_018810 [Liquidambar formosana]|uniref:Smr domain-containing protein n=1 Tax=Liquidambar formosana TaxID=63359 RepID=A0AAP0RAK7_LIQFO